ncbi:MAG: hypothetical protein JJ992_22390 [Planctomycetes bacterium]|nr:hypothetical protein [Planctomycetota bacterium]
MALRQVEIDYHVAVIDMAAEMFQQQNELRSLEKSRQQTDQILADLQKRLDGETTGLELAERFAKALHQENLQQAEQPTRRLQELEQEVAGFPSAVQDSIHDYLRIRRKSSDEDAAFAARGDELKRENSRYRLRLVTAQQQGQVMELSDIVRAYPANRLNGRDKLAVYADRWGEFLTGMPREANSEGGVFPAIWGTVVMTLIMSLVVVPFGVLAALYLREYAKSGPIVSAVRISINNLPDGYSTPDTLIIEEGHTSAETVLTAAPGAESVDAETWKQVNVTATADVLGADISHEVTDLGHIKLTDPPKAVLHLLMPDGSQSGLHLKPGGRVKALLRAERAEGFNGELKCEVHNLPHGVIVDNIGLNGVMIRAGESERMIFISAADWVAPMTRPVFASATGSYQEKEKDEKTGKEKNVNRNLSQHSAPLSLHIDGNPGVVRK